MSEYLNEVLADSLTVIHDEPKKHARRGHVFLGYPCSYKCAFCYGNVSRALHPFISKDSIIEYLKFIKAYGILDVEFTGGEPTIYPENDFLDILKFSKENFEKISIISNGCADLKYYRKLGEFADDFVFSLHGYDMLSHEKITGVAGSWKKINDAISGCEKPVRINTTICRYNYEYLFEHACHVSKNFSNIIAINYLPANSWDESMAIEDASVPYEKYSWQLAYSIMRICKDVKISIRYAPFCAFPEHIRPYVMGHVHHMYDAYDWNQELDGKTIYPEYLEHEYGFFSVAKIREKRKSLYRKFKFCVDCKYFHVCDGFQKNQIEREFPYIIHYRKQIGV